MSARHGVILSGSETLCMMSICEGGSRGNAELWTPLGDGHEVIRVSFFYFILFSFLLEIWRISEELSPRSSNYDTAAVRVDRYLGANMHLLV